MKPLFGHTMPSGLSLLAADGVTTRELARLFGVKSGTVSRAARGRNWGSVPALVAENLKRRGARMAGAKLDEAKGLDTRARHAAGMTGVDLAREYGVSNAAMNNVLRRLTWPHF